MIKILKEKIWKRNSKAPGKANDRGLAPSSEFQLKYIKLSDTRKARKPRHARVGFSKDGQYIIINGEKEKYDGAYLNNEGMSRDYFYHKLSAPEFIFWVKPEDYVRFVQTADGSHGYSDAASR